MLQEHHLSVERVQTYGTILPGEWDMFWVPAIGPNQTRGVVCIAIAKKLKSLIVEKLVGVPGRAQLVVLQMQSQKWGFLNIYAPNHEIARAQFWRNLRQRLPMLDVWCVAGDFNMLEDPLDRLGGSATTVHGEELAEWERLCMTLSICDVWHLPNVYKDQESMKFSRSNRSVVNLNLSRLDRFYASKDLVMYGGRVNIISGVGMSDHAPVMLLLFDSFKLQTGCARLTVPDTILSENITSHKFFAFGSRTRLS